LCVKSESASWTAGPDVGHSSRTLSDVGYEFEGEAHVVPLVEANLRPADPATLRATAERYEVIARELRRLATQ
jgi:hypothetical protein